MFWIDFTSRVMSRVSDALFTLLCAMAIALGEMSEP